MILRGHLDYVDRTLIEKWFQTLSIRIDRFHQTWMGERASTARWLTAFVHYYNTQRPNQALEYRTPTEEVINNARHCLAVTISEYNKRHIKSEFDATTPIDVVHAGIRPEKFSLTESAVENRILAVLRFVKKRLPYALEAVATVAERIPTVEYHIVGSGELSDELERKTEELGIEGNVTFLSRVSDQRLLAEFDEARCFLLPCVVAESGDRDGIPVALMEAMAMKTPVVSTTVSGIPELIKDGKNGFLTAPKDPGATARAVLRVLRNDEEWERCRERARETIISEFNITHETKKLEETIEAARSSG